MFQALQLYLFCFIRGPVLSDKCNELIPTFDMVTVLKISHPLHAVICRIPPSGNAWPTLTAVLCHLKGKTLLMQNKSYCSLVFNV